MMVLQPDSEFFRYFNDKGGAAGVETTTPTGELPASGHPPATKPALLPRAAPPVPNARIAPPPAFPGAAQTPSRAAPAAAPTPAAPARSLSSE